MYSHIFENSVLTFQVLFYVYGANAQPLPFDTVVGFGDSNSDTGNVYNLTNHTWPLVPPYFQGRFSNGPVWIERLGVPHLENHAHGGATTDNDVVQGFTASDTKPVPGVRQQISLYSNKTGIGNGNFARTLHIIWAGGNDYYFNQTLSPSAVASSLLNGVQDLLKIGAKHLLVVNQSPVHLMPFVQTEEQVQHYRERTRGHNNHLSTGLEGLAYDRHEISLSLFDVYTLMLNITSNGSSRWANKKDPCWNIVNGTVVILCSDPNSYVFIDQYHYTARVHELIADALMHQIRVRSSALVIESHSVTVTLISLVCIGLNFV